MDFEWVAIALGDVSWISLAFAMGFLSRAIGLPPLVGFLATGFILNYSGIHSGEMLQKLADLGITLLLFTVGLKLNLKLLVRPQVWAVTLLHILSVMFLFSLLISALALFNMPLFSELDWRLTLLMAFAMSFSSTVFAVKALEDKGDMKALHGRIAIGILVMQDLAAVVFLAVSTGKLPTAWALLLLALFPARPVLHYLLSKAGHGELLVLYGLVLALGGAELFELGGVKDDLGALVMGVLISSHAKASEMAKTMLGFKDLFLVGFFLTIGMTGMLTPEALMIGVLLAPLVVIKSVLFFLLMTRFKLRARTSLLASLNLNNYSEFGLIVTAIGVSSGWINGEWLVVMAIALSVSFIVASPFISAEDHLYRKYRDFWTRFQRRERYVDDKFIDPGDATIVVFGMGRVGSGAYERMYNEYGSTVVGIDFDEDRVAAQNVQGRRVLHGDPSDADFWDKFESRQSIELVMLALPNLTASLDALAQLRQAGYQGKIAATVRYPDDVAKLKEAGATAVFNIYTEAGAGFADHVRDQLAITGPAASS